MNKIEKTISYLNSPNKNTRYEACKELRVAAASLGEQIRLERGVEEAVNLIEATFGMIT